jgi:hypothetical protein
LLFLPILGFAAATPVLLRIKLPLLLATLTPKRALPKIEPERTRRTIHCVETALALGRPWVRPGCLTRAITLYYFLRRAGLDLTLCFGMGDMGGKLVGHCWLLKDQEPYLERQDPRLLYVETYRFPGEATKGSPAPMQASQVADP